MCDPLAVLLSHLGSRYISKGMSNPSCNIRKKNFHFFSLLSLFFLLMGVMAGKASLNLRRRKRGTTRAVYLLFHVPGPVVEKSTWPRTTFRQLASFFPINLRDHKSSANFACRVLFSGVEGRL